MFILLQEWLDQTQWHDKQVCDGEIASKTIMALLSVSYVQHIDKVGLSMDILRDLGTPFRGRLMLECFSDFPRQTIEDIPAHN